MRFAHFVDKNNIGMLVVPAWQRQQLAVVAVWTRGVSSRYGDLPGLGRSAEPRLSAITGAGSAERPSTASGSQTRTGV